jgi:hypothetical protein
MARKKAEEQEPEENSWSGLKKTIIGTLTTVIAGGGVWLSTTLFGGGEEPKEETKTEQTVPAGQAPVIVNVQQNQENKQKVENGGNTVIRERVIEKPATQEAPKPKKEEEDSW